MSELAVRLVLNLGSLRLISALCGFLFLVQWLSDSSFSMFASGPRDKTDYGLSIRERVRPCPGYPDSIGLSPSESVRVRESVFSLEAGSTNRNPA